MSAELAQKTINGNTVTLVDPMTSNQNHRKSPDSTKILQLETHYPEIPNQVMNEL